ncbi:MAG: MFS transporter, partial [Promethearchaeota archaeon]
GASGYHPSVFPALAEKFPKKSRATATGIQAIGGLVGMAIIPFLGVTLLVIFGGWRESFVLLSLAGFALFVPVTALMVYSRREHFDEEMGHVGGDGPDGWTRNFALLVVLMALRGMSFRCTTLLMPLYLVESEYSYDPILAGSFTTVMLVAGLVGEIVSAPLSDRVGRRVPFLIVSTGVSTPFLLLLNASLSQAGLLLVLIAIGFFFFLGVPPNTAYQTEVVPKQSQGLAFGLLFSVGAIPGSLSPIVFGWIGDVYGLPMSIVFLVVTTGLATIFAALLKEEKEPKRDTSIALELIRVPD